MRARDAVCVQVSVHDRRQSQLSAEQKDNARLLDYDGKQSHHLDPANLFEQYNPKKHDQAEKNMIDSIEVAENIRDS
jgi:hypothetical protein